MKTLRLLLLLAAASTSAFAWPACSGQWVSVPKITTGGTLYSTGDLLFQCQSLSPSTPSPASSSAAASSLSSSSATSSASSVVSATQKQNQSQNQTATGTGGTATATSGGGNQSTTNNTLVQRNTPMAYAPEAIPSAPCVKGYSGGASGAAFGASVGGGKTDKECEIRETARAFALGGSHIAFCKVLITTKDAKRAGVTLDDCMAEPLSIEQVTAPAPDPVPPTIVIPTTIVLQQPPVTLPVQPTPPKRKRVTHKTPHLCESQVLSCKQ